MAANQVNTRKLIVDTYLKNKDWSQVQLAKHLKIPRSTVQTVLYKYKEPLSVERKVGSGRKREKGSCN